MSLKRRDERCGPPCLLSNGQRVLFSGDKAAGSEIGHSPSSSAKVKMHGFIPSHPHTSSWLGKRTNLSLYALGARKVASQIRYYISCSRRIMRVEISSSHSQPVHWVR